MRGDLVEEQNRRNPGQGGDEARVREHQSDEQRLLLAGRGFTGGDSFWPMRDQQVGKMWALEGASRCCVTRARLAQRRAIAVLEFGCGARVDRILDRT